MTTQPIRLRSDFLNTQVITRSSGKRLGVVKDLLVDIDRREVVALGLRDNLLSVAGMPRYMYLNDIVRTGDVILVENEEVIDDVDITALNRLINCEAITEAGEALGRVRDFKFNLETGQVEALIIAYFGLPQIPDQVISTYELAVEDIVSSGPDRIIVFEGAEERLTQLTVGVLERIGIGKPPWEREEEEPYFQSQVRPENQLGTGIPVNAPPRVQPAEEAAPVYEQEAWTEDEWQEAELEPAPQRPVETVRYRQLDEEQNWEDEETNWEDTPLDRQAPASPRESEPVSYSDHDIDTDVWEDEERPEFKQPLNIPQKQKAPEYQEETEY